MCVRVSPTKKKATGYRTIQTSGHGCEECGDKDRRGSVIEQVGESEHSTYLDGKMIETEKHFRCKSCGSKWVNYTVDGLGGYGSFWIPQ
jgi:hypothetical protein